MQKIERFCQSCGMPLKNDTALCGTEKDQSKSLKYCTYCYQNGEFTFKGTVEEFQEACKKIMIEKGMIRPIAWLFTRGMKRLERWKK